jgi:DHA3 family tetracycline resistance protein-like MFS transporter
MILKKLDSYRLYIGTAFWFRFCWALMTTVSMVFMVTVAGLDPLQMVLVGTVLELSTFLFEIPTGVVADVYSRRASIIIGYIMVGAGYMLLGFYPRFDVILLSQVIWGCGFTFISGASQAWISDEIGESRANAAFITASQIGKVGLLIGIAVCIALAMIDLKIPIIVGSSGLVLLGVFCLFFMGESRYRSLQDDERESWQKMAATLSDGVQLVRTHPVLWIIILIALFEGMYSEGYDRLFAPFLIESFEFPTLAGLDAVIWWGVLSAGATVLAFIALELVRRFVNTSNYRHLVMALTVCCSLLVGTMLAFVLAGSFYVAVFVYFAVAVLRSVKGPLSTAWLNQNLESDTRATVFSMQAQADAIGQVGGGPVVGAIGKFYSLQMALLVTTVALIPAVGLYRKALGIKQVEQS